MNNILTWLADLFQSFLGDSIRQINKLEVNLKNAHKRLDTIRQTYYPQYQKDKHHYLSRNGALWLVRKDLEAARYYYTGGREGYATSDRVQDMLKLYLVDPRFKELKEVLDETERQVQEMEQAKGYQFITVEANNIIYRELSTGKVLTPADSNHV
jgi:hypothetical protein